MFRYEPVGHDNGSGMDGKIGGGSKSIFKEEFSFNFLVERSTGLEGEYEDILMVLK